MGLDPEKFPPVEAPGKVVGQVTPAMAKALDLPADCDPGDELALTRLCTNCIAN